jgi:hypothetical protein
MKGKVVNLNGDLCAVEISTGIIVFEILGAHSTEIDDIISGELENLGGESLFNETKDENIDTFIEDIHCTDEFTNDFINRQS